MLEKQQLRPTFFLCLFVYHAITRNETVENLFMFLLQSYKEPLPECLHFKSRGGNRIYQTPSKLAEIQPKNQKEQSQPPVSTKLFLLTLIKELQTHSIAWRQASG